VEASPAADRKSSRFMRRQDRASHSSGQGCMAVSLLPTLIGHRGCRPSARRASHSL